MLTKIKMTSDEALPLWGSWRGLFVVLLVFFSFAFVADETKPLPAYTGFVNDFENILTPEQERVLTQIISAHEKKTSNEIAVVTVNNFYGYQNINDFSLNLANAWGVGKKEKNNGVVIVVSKYWSGVSIKNGLGMTDKITDSETKKIIDQKMLPYFRSELFYEGIKEGVEAIILEIK